MTKKRLKIFIDLDETTNTLLKIILSLYNAKYGDKIKFEELTDYDTHRFLKPECKNVFAEFCDDDLLENLGMQPNALESITELMLEHDVYFLTAGHPITMKSRDRWLANRFPLYTSDKLIMCRDKSLIHGDILIDDCPHNMCDSYKVCLLFNQPWNMNTKCESNCYWVKDWNNAMETIELLTKEVNF